VTRGTIVRDASVIEARACPIDSRVTVGTHVACWRVIRCFPRAHPAVVAGSAIGRGLGVVEVYDTPGVVRVTGGALIRRWRVIR
jgi:hypothetical protein